MSDGSGSELSDDSADGSSLEGSSPGWLDSPDVPSSDFSSEASVSDGRLLVPPPGSALVPVVGRRTARPT